MTQLITDIGSRSVFLGYWVGICDKTRCGYQIRRQASVDAAIQKIVGQGMNQKTKQKQKSREKIARRPRLE